MFTALAHPARRRILMTVHFHGGAMTAGEIADMFEHAWPTTTPAPGGARIGRVAGTRTTWTVSAATGSTAVGWNSFATGSRGSRNLPSKASGGVQWHRKRRPNRCQPKAGDASDGRCTKPVSHQCRSRRSGRGGRVLHATLRADRPQASGLALLHFTRGPVTLQVVDASFVGPPHPAAKRVIFSSMTSMRSLNEPNR